MIKAFGHNPMDKLNKKPPVEKKITDERKLFDWEKVKMKKEKRLKELKAIKAREEKEFNNASMLALLEENALDFPPPKS